MSAVRALIGDLLYNFWYSFSSPSQLGFLTLGVGGLLVLLFVGGYNLIPDAVLTASLFDSFAIFAFVMVGMSGPVRMLEEHRMGGTLEQLYLSPIPVSVLCAVRSLTGALTYVPTFAICLLGLALTGSSFRIAVTGSRAVLWLLLWTASVGVGYMVAAFSLLGPLANRILGAAIFVMVTLSMIQVKGEGLSRILAILVPPMGATAIVGTLDQPVFWSFDNIGRLGVVCIAYLLVGLAVFFFAEKAALRRGSLVRYYF